MYDIQNIEYLQLPIGIPGTTTGSVTQAASISKLNYKPPIDLLSRGGGTAAGDTTAAGGTITAGGNTAAGGTTTGSGTQASAN